MPAPSHTLLYLSRADADAALPSPPELIAAVEQTFAAYATGSVKVGPKARIPTGTGHFFQTMPGALAEPALTGMKWFGVVPENPARGLPNVSGLIILSDTRTALPLAVLDANVITGARTAAMTAMAARRLAPEGAHRLAFIGCGTQARAHAAYLRAVLPNLSHAALFGRGAASRDGFAAELRGEGWQVAVWDDAATAIAGADLVVSTVPEYEGFAPFLDAGQLKPGAFAAGVDLGRSWLPASFAQFGIVATDDAEQSLHLIEEGRLNAPARFDADLAALASGRLPPHRPEDRVFFVFAGHVLGDLAAAALVYRRAKELGIGLPLPL